MNNIYEKNIELRPSYDYVVIGSGSSGSIVASKLSENPNTTVLLLEAGKFASTVPDVWNPNKINCLYNDKSIDWGYETVPQRNMDDRVLEYSRAKMTGGCTSHNDMVYTRGARADFDLWESQYGCSGWNYDNIEHNFQNVEAVINPSMTIENEFSTSYITACNDLGIPFNPDYNSGQSMFGVSPFRFTIASNSIRETSFKSYITPNLNRPNLDVFVFSKVSKLVFDNEKTISEVIFVNNETNFSAKVNNEAILSAGAINTPAILMRSGIGNGTVLNKLGVKNIVSDLTGVGLNLQDAIIFKGTWSSRQPILNQPWNIGYAIVWANLNNYGQPTNCLEMMRGVYQCDETEKELESFYSITGGAMRLKSRGEVTLKSLNPNEKPTINLDFYSDPEDMQQAITAFKLMRDVGNSNALYEWRSKEIAPGPNVQTEAEIKDWILANSFSYSHASGTCKMGTSGLDVVDSNLRVLGVNGLRIADTSVMPEITSGHTQGPAFMIGDKAAELILTDC